MCRRVKVRCCEPWGRHVRGLCRNVPQVEGEEFDAMGLLYVKGLCRNVPQVESEEFDVMGFLCERVMSKCALGSG